MLNLLKNYLLISLLKSTMLISKEISKCSKPNAIFLPLMPLELSSMIKLSLSSIVNTYVELLIINLKTQKHMIKCSMKEELSTYQISLLTEWVLSTVLMNLMDTSMKTPSKWDISLKISLILFTTPSKKFSKPDKEKEKPIIKSPSKWLKDLPMKSTPSSDTEAKKLSTLLFKINGTPNPSEYEHIYAPLIYLFHIFFIFNYLKYSLL